MIEVFIEKKKRKLFRAEKKILYQKFLNEMK